MASRRALFTLSRISLFRPPVAQFLTRLRKQTKCMGGYISIENMLRFMDAPTLSFVGR
jgi:hypothetical protein